MCKPFLYFSFVDLDTFWAKLRLINEDLQIAKIPKSKKPWSQASDTLASIGMGRT
jgi:hypothetical protein